VSRFGWLRGLGRVTYQTPPAEPHKDDLDIIPGLFGSVPEKLTRQLRELDESVERRIQLYDQALRDLIADGAPPEAIDAMLTARNRVRPPRPAQVPVIPGRS
jgi:hypothetical protein